MKTKTFVQLSNGGRRIVIGRIALLFVMVGMVSVLAGPGESVGTNTSIDDQIVSAVVSQSTNEIYGGEIEGLIRNASLHRTEVIQSLLRIFNDPQSTHYVKCCAAKYFGEIRAFEAADSLAAQISMRNPGADPGTSRGDFLGFYPMADALEKIGTPAIPAVIRNLAEIDDQQVWGLSWQVLATVDGGDTEVMKVQLQKALDAQPDATRKARLQLRIKSLTDPDPKFKPTIRL